MNVRAHDYIQGLVTDSIQAEQSMLQLADEMASAAVGFTSPQGYDSFIESRAKFRKAVRNYHESVRIHAARLLH